MMFESYSPLSPLATHIGIVCLTTQILLTLLFINKRRIGEAGPWTYLPGLTAHQVVSLPLMIILAYCGCRDWLFDTDIIHGATAATSSYRIFSISNPNNIHLAIGTGAILIWDIPTSFIFPPLRDRLMLAHHVGMFLTAYIMNGGFSKHGNQIGYYYVPYYFGVIEFSSIFLAYIDIFHPKYVYYHRWLNAEHGTLQATIKRMNDIGRALFAISFLILRGVYFPYVSFCCAIPDLFAAYQNPPDGVPMWTGYFLIIMIASFTCLQIYWSVLVAKNVRKVLRGGSAEDDNAKIARNEKKTK